jgi:hypothetical protein
MMRKHLSVPTSLSYEGGVFEHHPVAYSPSPFVPGPPSAANPQALHTVPLLYSINDSIDLPSDAERTFVRRARSVANLAQFSTRSMSVDHRSRLDDASLLSAAGASRVASRSLPGRVYVYHALYQLQNGRIRVSDCEI